MKSIDKIKLSSEATVKEAIEIINDNSLRIALIVENGKLLGVIADPDIRRAMLNGFTLDSPVEKIYTKNPFVCKIYESKEEIIKKAVSKNIYEIPIVDDQQNVMGIELLTELLNAKKYNNKVIIMAGGLGSRLYPLTKETPKPLLEVGNKPILETIIENFSKYGFSEFLISVNYKSHMIEEYFGDGSAFGVNIEYIHEAKRMGTAGALSLVKNKLTKSFFVMNGDLLTNINFENLLNFHQQEKAAATMCVREYDFQVPYGVVDIENGVIKSIEEKPVQKFFVSAGIYMLDPNVLGMIPKDTFYDMPTLFENIIVQQKRAVSFPIREYWLDIGRMEEFERANIEYHEIF